MAGEDTVLSVMKGLFSRCEEVMETNHGMVKRLGASS